EAAGAGYVPDMFCPEALGLRRAAHRAIASVTVALEDFAFNVAVARLYELANAISEAERAASSSTRLPGLAWARREAMGILARLIGPMTPHLAEAIHALLEPDDQTLIAEKAWPEPDPALLAAEQVTIAVQVMGKLRGTIALPPDSAEQRVLAEAEAEPNVARLLAGRKIVKRIYVPNRIVNFVLAA
ncbi:MAG: class I tRNA ligase family protein, partial [Alphaproteobacteria bacterium]|nr:class I tRNA ligase family protein [Alphaproteobacteria bacterium]